MKSQVNIVLLILLVLYSLRCTSSIHTKHRNSKLSQSTADNTIPTKTVSILSKLLYNRIRRQAATNPTGNSTRCSDCGQWSAWSKWICCNNSSCSCASLTLTKGRGSCRSRVCNGASSVSNACGLDVEIKREPCITGRASVSSGGRPSGAGGAIIKNDQPYTDPASSQPINSFVKIIIFTVAGAVMVTLLAFAATRISKTIKIPLARGRPRSSTLEADDIEYSAVNQEVSPSTPRVVVLNTTQLQQLRRQQGRRMVPPSSNLSVIREEEADDVFAEENDKSVPGSDVSYDDETDAAPSPQRKDCDEALDYMDGIISQIEDADEVYDDELTNERLLTRLSTLLSQNHQCRDSLDAELLSDFGWKPRGQVAPNEPVRFERLKDSPGEGFLSASALSLASARLLEAGNRRSSSIASSYLTADDMYFDNSMTSSTSMCELRRNSSQTDALKRFSSMPDMTKATAVIPDVQDVLSGCVDPWE